jgi:hypothetical protein
MLKRSDDDPERTHEVSSEVPGALWIYKNCGFHVGDILAKDFDCSFSEVAAADQVTEVSSFNCFYYKNNVLPSVLQHIGCLHQHPNNEFVKPFQIML